ncbi:hypothetical protein TD95_003355 [Thielaviopsis punctulata]|uniref:Alpha/beta hydrolase fold-3 domain-containing protein n=1 Tax=Thielaviopsis punctulata TaxID=72032 RepID=A0A0F4ZJI0_9PEZI|nr:hypothetical protein TD95_003355 [Thielaviopsis punctulata]
MIDHVLGRPSARSRRIQVLAVLSFWMLYLKRGNKHGPPVARILSKFVTKRLTPWQIVTMTIMYLYAARNISSLVGLSSLDPLSNMYEANFFRATWVLTALDAGFWTAMKIKNQTLRNMASLLFTVFYLFAADMADEKVRRVRGNLTIDHMRASWNKGTTPYLRFFQNLVRPRLMNYKPRELRIPRPAESDYTEPVKAWLYFDGPLSALQKHTKVLMDIPGGGFVAMDPRCNDDKLMCWAGRTGLPVLALDYKKAPEFPYPYALNECFDVYTMLIHTNGRCIGLAGTETPKIVISGDSSGGNLAVGTTLMILERTVGHLALTGVNNDLPRPEGLLLFYPSLDMNIGSWMSDEEMALIRDRSMRGTNKTIVRRKSMQYNSLVGTPHHSDDEETSAEAVPRNSADKSRLYSLAKKGKKMAVAAKDDCSEAIEASKTSTSSSFHPRPLSTRLAMSSKISYFNDRVLTPEMMRAMVIMYIGPHNRPDFRSDYLLSPNIAPDSLLSHFPKTFFLTGERDPLVDDTVIFAGRLRQARRFLFDDVMDTENASRVADDGYREADILEVTLLPGVSHGFMQFPTLYPRAWDLLNRSADWIDQSFKGAAGIRRREARRRDILERRAAVRAAAATAESSDDEDLPLEMARVTPKVRPQLGSFDGGRGRSGSDTVVVSLYNSGSSLVRHQDEGGSTASVDDVQRLPSDKDGPMTWKDKIERLVAKKVPQLEKLNSEEDLLGRRMQGLTNGLIGQERKD